MKKTNIFFIFLIVVAGFAVYANSLQGELLWDDETIVVDNPYTKSFSFLPQIFSSGLFHAYGVGKGSFYRPLQVLSYVVDHKFWGLSPLGYHLTNTILHILCAILFYGLVVYLSADSKAALISALLFVAHPIHTQAVSYISGRAEPLSIAFMLASFLCFMQFLSKAGSLKGRLLYTASLFFFVLAVLSKESAIILPLFPLFYICLFEKEKRKAFLSTVPFFAFAFIYVILRYTVLNFFDETFLSQTPIYLRLLTTVKNIFAYLGLLVAPLGLHMEREVVFVSSFFDLRVLASLVLLFLILIWMRRVRKKNTVVFFFAGWFFLGLLPYCNIFALNATLAEHWIYLPSMGVFALAGLACARVFALSKERPAKIPLKLIVIFLIVGATIAYGALTIRRNRDWRDTLTISLATKKYVPGNYKVRNNLGRVYFHKEMLDEAIVEYQASVKIQPLYAQAHSNLGLAYAQKGQSDKALKEYERALELEPTLSKTYIIMADLYLRENKLKKALQVYERGIAKHLSDPYLYSLYGLALAENGQLDKAIEQGKISIQLGADDANLYYNLAVIYEYNRQGIRYGQDFNLKAAEEYYQRALQRVPDHKEANCNLQYLYNRWGKP